MLFRSHVAPVKFKELFSFIEDFTVCDLKNLCVSDNIDNTTDNKPSYSVLEFLDAFYEILEQNTQKQLKKSPYVTDLIGKNFLFCAQYVRNFGLKFCTLYFAHKLCLIGMLLV